MNYYLLEEGRRKKRLPAIDVIKVFFFLVLGSKVEKRSRGGKGMEGRGEREKKSGEESLRDKVVKVRKC